MSGDTRVLMRSDAEAFLYREARLLDERRFEDWLALFTEDGRYDLPGGPGEGVEESEPSVAIIADDHANLEDRVQRLRSPVTFAQSPPSRTVHAVLNVEVLEGHEDGGAEIASVWLVHEARGGHTRVFAARCRHRLRWEEGAGWRIASKEVRLLNRDQPLYNLTFLL